MFYAPTASRPRYFLLRRPMFFITKTRQKAVEKKAKKKSRPKKKAGPETPENSYKKPIQNSKQQRGRLRRRPIFGVVVMNFELVF